MMSNYPFQYYDAWLNKQTADALLETLSQQLCWQEETFFIYGRKIRVPRLVAWVADPGCDYTYSGIKHTPQAWTPTLQQLKERLNNEFNLTLNSVLANFYRNNHEYMGWHRDNEPSIVRHSVIASISLGAARKFLLRHRISKEKHVIKLAAGSLLLMLGNCQEEWEHCLPKTKSALGPRINLTFRTMRSIARA